MATIEQATMPYALDALRRHASLRKLASPELTSEGDQRRDRARAGRQDAARRGQDRRRRGHDRPTTSSRAQQSTDHAHRPLRRQRADDVQRRRAQGDDRHQARRARRQGQEDGQAGRRARSRRATVLGLGTGSLSSYIRTPKQLGREPRRLAAPRRRPRCRGDVGAPRQRRRHLLRRHGAGRPGHPRPRGRRSWPRPRSRPRSSSRPRTARRRRRRAASGCRPTRGARCSPGRGRCGA